MWCILWMGLAGAGGMEVGEPRQYPLHLHRSIATSDTQGWGLPETLEVEIFELRGGEGRICSDISLITCKLFPFCFELKVLTPLVLAVSYATMTKVFLAT